TCSCPKPDRITSAESSGRKSAKPDDVNDPNERPRRMNGVTMTATIRARSVATMIGGERADAVLLARLQAGDDDALGAIYDVHADLVYGVARRVTRDEQLARDITQEVFTYLWELPGRVDLLRGSLRSYLAVVAHRRAVDEVRRCERRTRT